MSPYEYVVLRCVPRVDREEFLNVGVVLHCRDDDFLGTSGTVDDARLRAVGGVDPARVREALAYAEAVCAGAAPGLAAEPLSRRFGLLKAPRSTVVQPGPVHGGLTADPAATLAHLHATLVATER